MAAPNLYKLDDGASFPTNCFPARTLFRQQEEGSDPGSEYPGHNPTSYETTYLVSTRVDPGPSDPPQDVGRHALTWVERDKMHAMLHAFCHAQPSLKYLNLDKNGITEVPYLQKMDQYNYVCSPVLEKQGGFERLQPRQKLKHGKGLITDLKRMDKPLTIADGNVSIADTDFSPHFSLPQNDMGNIQVNDHPKSDKEEVLESKKQNLKQVSVPDKYKGFEELLDARPDPEFIEPVATILRDKRSQKKEYDEALGLLKELQKKYVRLHTAAVESAAQIENQNQEALHEINKRKTEINQNSSGYFQH
ncbi:UNVERIFIED_CONTAM: hypothetical protein FKN15_008754 [Acipenser sinensis]